MAREHKLHEFDGDYYSYEQIAERTGLSYQSCLRLVAMGVTSTEEARAIISPKPRRTRAEIIASLPKVESAKPSALPKPQPVNQNAIVRIRHAELDKMLNYLARTSHTTYQAAFEEFIIYLYEGRLWGKEAQSNQEAIAAIKQRLIDNHNGRDMGGESYEPIEEKPQALKGWQKELIPYMESLEEENQSLKATIERLKSILG